MTDIATFCRICEPSCGLVAEVDGGRLVKLRPDREHPVTEGFACHKGLAALDVHHDPDRLDHPMVRAADGSWARVSWDDALRQVATGLRAVVDRHGPNAVASYVGNPMAFNALGRVHTDELLAALGVRRRFSSGTQDCANKFVASQATFGTALVHPIPDLANTDLCLIIGENPRASQASFWSIPNVLGRMRRRAAAGARFVFVNPRLVETPEGGIGDTIQIRPDTDVWFLAALLAEIDRRGGFDDGVIARHGRNVDGLRAFVSRYPADRVEHVTGVPAATVAELAQTWIDTPRASVHASTGINMGRQGTLAYWLVHMLSFVTGRLDVEGGNLKSDGFFANARAGAAPMEQSYVDTEFGRLRAGVLPGTLLTQAVLDADDPIRAMIVVSGNPLLSIAGEDRLRKAFEQLELLVVADIYPTATAELADVVLPCTDAYEREDLNIVNIGTAAQPFAQYTPAVVEPAAERRPEWWIARELRRAMAPDGSEPSLDDDVWGKWRHLLRKGSGIELDELMASGRPVVLPEPVPGTFYHDQVQTPDGRVDCCPPSFAEAIERCRDLFDEASATVGDGRFLLIHGRDPWMHNSWFANVERMRRRGRGGNPLRLHPDDAAGLGVAEGDRVRVASAHGEVATTVEIGDDLLPGVVLMIHGGGHQASPGLRVASARPGANPNALLPIGDGSFEPLSSQAHMTGIPVEVRPDPVS